MTAFGSNYATPGWQRAQAKKAGGTAGATGAARGGGEIVRERGGALPPG